MQEQSSNNYLIFLQPCLDFWQHKNSKHWKLFAYCRQKLYTMFLFLKMSVRVSSLLFNAVCMAIWVYCLRGVKDLKKNAWLIKEGSLCTNIVLQVNHTSIFYVLLCESYDLVLSPLFCKNHARMHRWRINFQSLNPGL